MYSNDNEIIEQIIVQIILDTILAQGMIKILPEYTVANSYVYYSTHLKYFAVQLYTQLPQVDASYLLHNLLKKFEMNQVKLEEMKNKLLGELFFCSDDLSMLSGELRQLFFNKCNFT